MADMYNGNADFIKFGSRDFTSAEVEMMDTGKMDDVRANAILDEPTSMSHDSHLNFDLKEEKDHKGPDMTRLPSDYVSSHADSRADDRAPDMHSAYKVNHVPERNTSNSLTDAYKKELDLERSSRKHEKEMHENDMRRLSQRTATKYIVYPEDVTYRRWYDWGTGLFPSYYTYNQRQYLESILEKLIKRELSSRQSDDEIRRKIQEMVKESVPASSAAKRSGPKKSKAARSAKKSKPKKSKAARSAKKSKPKKSKAARSAKKSKPKKK
jgi:hypothetical protein